MHEELFNALLYLKVHELRDFCVRLKIPKEGEKIILIEKIQHYILTGKILETKKIPAISKAQSKITYPLAPNTPILHGSFKNDLKTRVFLKSLIGNHFHYTAFGIDWIKDRWFKGAPPTYREFAEYWQKEYIARQKTKGALKPEWAYLNYLETYKQENPNASQADALSSWKKFREKQYKIVKSILDPIIDSL